jgi:hypothetical protein
MSIRVGGASANDGLADMGMLPSVRVDTESALRGKTADGTLTNQGVLGEKRGGAN